MSAERKRKNKQTGGARRIHEKCIRCDESSGGHFESYLSLLTFRVMSASLCVAAPFNPVTMKRRKKAIKKKNLRNCFLAKVPIFGTLHKHSPITFICSLFFEYSTKLSEFFVAQIQQSVGKYKPQISGSHLHNGDTRWLLQPVALLNTSQRCTVAQVMAAH